MQDSVPVCKRSEERERHQPERKPTRSAAYAQAN